MVWMKQPVGHACKAQTHRNAGFNLDFIHHTETKATAHLLVDSNKQKKEKFMSKKLDVLRSGDAMKSSRNFEGSAGIPYISGSIGGNLLA